MPSIFILDDDISLLSVIEFLLPKFEYEVRTFSRSADLLNAINDCVPDIMLLDVWLSEEINGKILCRQLKQQYKYPYKILLFSASHVSLTDLQNCGADGFIEKPFEISTFRNIISAAYT